jgi:hypothetical protein
MVERTPDLDDPSDRDAHGPGGDRFAHVRDLLIRAGPLPELPESLMRPAAALVRCPPAGPPPR